MPFSSKDFFKLAYGLVYDVYIPRRLNNENKCAEKHFYFKFMSRHPQLCLQNAESTDIMRTVGFNKRQVS